jgi:predicted transposase YdaD
MLATRAETWKRQWLEEGEQKGRLEGRLEGRQEGRQEGEAALLLRLLERRFGALPDWVRDRIAGADTASLEEWGVRVLDAGSLEDVLA